MTQNDQVTGDQPPRDETQEQRALRTIQAIFSGGDLGAETLQLSNEFTDAQVERLKRAVRRRSG